MGVDVLYNINNNKMNMDTSKNRTEKAVFKDVKQNHGAHLRQVQISKNSTLLMAKWDHIPVWSLKHMLGVEYSCINRIMQEYRALRWCNNHMQNTGGYVLLTQRQLVNINCSAKIQFTVTVLMWLFGAWEFGKELHR